MRGLPSIAALLLALGTLPGAAAPAWAAARATADVTVRVAPESVVHRDDLALGDVAAVEGDEALAARLRALGLGPAPLPGTTLRLPGDELRQRIRVPVADLARVRWSFPEHVAITRAFQVLTGAAIVEAVTLQAPGRVERLGASREGEGPPVLIPLGRPADLRLPTGDVEIVPRFPDVGAASTFVPVTVAIRVAGRDYQTLSLAFRVDRFRPVLVAAHALAPKTALVAADFREDSRPSADVPPDALAGPLEAADLEAVRPLQPGEILTERTLRRKVLVRRGETVTLLLEGHGFRITTLGLAAEDARRGDPVRVVNASSRREVLGRVEGPGIVRIPNRAMAESRAEP